MACCNCGTALRHRCLVTPAAVIGAFIGSYSHVFNSVMRADVEPFAPCILHNPFLGFLSVEALHKFCLYSGLLGVGLYFSVSYWLGRHHPSHTRDTF